MDTQNNQTTGEQAGEELSPKQEKREAKIAERELAQKKQKFYRSLRRTVGWFVVLVLLVGAVWGIAKVAKTPSDNSGEAAMVTDVSSEKDHIFGNPEAKVVMIEYSDFQCPACAAYQPLVKQVANEYKDSLEFVYRHFPLPQHQNAKTSARAAEAAAKQNKFWEIHDLLFEKQTSWENSGNPENIFSEYAASLGLNTDQFKKDYNSSEIKDKVNQSYTDATFLRLDHTPTFFVNGKEISNPQSYQEFKNVIDQALAENK